MFKNKNALISVFDKTNLDKISKFLIKKNIQFTRQVDRLDI